MDFFAFSLDDDDDFDLLELFVALSADAFEPPDGAGGDRFFAAASTIVQKRKKK